FRVPRRRRLRALRPGGAAGPAAAERLRAAVRHVPLDLGRAGGRRVAGAAVPALTPAGAAVARRRAAPGALRRPGGNGGARRARGRGGHRARARRGAGGQRVPRERRCGRGRDRRHPQGRGSSGGLMPTILATVNYYEPWYVQIIKAIILFAVGLQLVPIVLIAERK